MHSVGYDPATETLQIRYKNGGTYEYSGVPQNTHDELMAADSVGSHLAQFVKGVHDFKRIE